MNHRINRGNLNGSGDQATNMQIHGDGNQTLCFTPSGARVTATHQFHITLDTENVKNEGELFMLFKIFEGNDELTNVNRIIKVNGTSRVTQNDEILVKSPDYKEINMTSRSFVDFEITTTFIVDATKGYHIVAQIIELDEHHDHGDDDEHEEPSNLNKTFQYYQNINLGGGHDADHLIVERINIC